MIQPIFTMLTTLLQQLTTLAPAIIAIALFIAGFVLAMGNHQRGKELAVMAFIGGAVMLGAQTMASSIHA